MRRLGLTVAVLIVVSAIEITVVIAVGNAIGWGATLLLLLATSLLGGWLLRREGGRAWRAFRADAQDGRPPGNAATNGVLILAGGVFMLVPGFVSDFVGLLLLIPPTRHLAARFIQRTLAGRITPAAATSLFGPRRVRVRYGQPDAGQPADANAGRPADAAPDGPGPRRAPGQVTDRPSGSPGDPIEGEIIDP
jgi:UPF0716 protein FxsA